MPIRHRSANITRSSLRVLNNSGCSLIVLKKAKFVWLILPLHADGNPDTMIGRAKELIADGVFIGDCV